MAIKNKDDIARVQKKFLSDMDAWNPVYRPAKEDLFFLSDDPQAQWDANAYNDRQRSGRPALTFDKLGQFTRQVGNQIRMNTPSINVIPSDRKSSQETALIIKGLIKDIEYRSKADIAYDTAAMFAIRCSVGFYKISKD